MYAGDTVFNSFLYHKLSFKFEFVQLPDGNLMYTDYGVIGYIRQDTVQEKVYYFQKSDDQEYLLYDFNLEIGDTCPPIYAHNYQPPLILINKDSVLETNGFRGRLILLPPGGGVFDTVKIVEGIGSESGLFTASGMCFEYCEWLACFQEDGETIYSSDMYNSYPFGFCHIVGVSNTLKNPENVLIRPSPAVHGEDVSIAGNSATEMNVIVFDLFGRKCWESTSNSISQEVKTYDFAKGMYIVKVTLDAKFFYTARIVIQ
jgi:hypothetical protein